MKKLLKEIKEVLVLWRDALQKSFDRYEGLTIRPYRCRRSAEIFNELICKIDKVLKRKRKKNKK